MVGTAPHPLGFQDSGQLWEWVSCGRFRGEIPGDSPLAWSDRGRPPGTDTVCSNPGWSCQLRHAAAACLPTACSGPVDHTDAPARSASPPATTHGLAATCATVCDRPRVRSLSYTPDSLESGHPRDLTKS